MRVSSSTTDQLSFLVPSADWVTRDDGRGMDGSSMPSPTIGHAGYGIEAAPPGAWRTFDPQNPDPGYYEFDWLSARHPDLYHEFALSTDGLIAELEHLVDLLGLKVIDVGAGTGRSAIGLSRMAAHVTAVDAYASVVDYGKQMVREAHVGNVSYCRADRSNLPAPENSVDAVVASWAGLDRVEAGRVLKPGGLLVSMGAHPAGAWELAAVLHPVFPDLVHPPQEGAPLTADHRVSDVTLPAGEWPDVRLVDDALHAHDFAYTADYGTSEEASAMFGRLFGPTAARYFHDRRQSTVWWRQRICYGRVEK